MPGKNLIQVSLDGDLVGRLLSGLLSGATTNALKVVVSTDGSYHIESKELRVVVRVDPAKADSIQSIEIANDKQFSVITAQDLTAMGHAHLGTDVVKRLKSNYSPRFHSLADNIVVFSRTYGEG